MPAAHKIRSLIEELKLKILDKELSDFFRGQYTNHVKACNMILNENYTEEQLEKQLQHVKSNLSTLQMLLNRSRGIMSEEEESDDIKPVQLLLFDW